MELLFQECEGRSRAAGHRELCGEKSMMRETGASDRRVAAPRRRQPESDRHGRTANHRRPHSAGENNSADEPRAHPAWNCPSWACVAFKNGSVNEARLARRLRPAGDAATDFRPRPPCLPPLSRARRPSVARERPQTSNDAASCTAEANRLQAKSVSCGWPAAAPQDDGSLHRSAGNASRFCGAALPAARVSLLQSRQALTASHAAPAHRPASTGQYPPAAPRPGSASRAPR